jgi:hypothetical protein
MKEGQSNTRAEFVLWFLVRRWLWMKQFFFHYDFHVA